MLTKREVILAKVETTYNTDPTPAAATDAVLVENPSLSFEGLRMHDRVAVKPTLGPKQGVYGGHLASLSFDVEVRGSGTVDSPPDIGDLLQACGFAETVVATTSVTYDPASSSLKSATIYYHQDGKLHTITGARGTVSFNLEAGGRIVASFTMTGHHAESDTALPSPTYDTTIPPVFVNASFAVGGYAGVIGALSFDIANTIAMPPNPNEADGYGEIRITNRDVTGSIDPEDTLIATNDWLGDLEAGASMALDTGVLGSTAGNQVQISMPAIYYREMSPGDRDGIRTREIGFGAVEDTGDDQLSLIFS